MQGEESNNVRPAFVNAGIVANGYGVELVLHCRRLVNLHFYEEDISVGDVRGLLLRLLGTDTKDLYTKLVHTVP